MVKYLPNIKGEKEKKKMKLKALSLSLLILLPLVIFAAPIANASIAGPVMWVNPDVIEKEGPCLVSSTFDITVKLWNKKDLTQVGVYAFDFNITWLNSTLGMGELCPGSQKDSFITLVNHSFTSPWDHYFVIADEIIKPFLKDGQYWTGYHLAITALDGSDPLIESQVTLATLTFHIDCEPLYPDEYSTPFNLEAVFSDNVPDKYGKYLPKPFDEVDDGIFTISVGQPDVHLLPAEWCEYKIGIAHTVEFWLTNINKVYGFGFEIMWNNTLLEADIQSIHICDAFPPPYEDLHMEVVDNGDGTSSLVFAMARPCEKPTVTHQPGPAATFVLNSIYDYPKMIPRCANSSIDLVSAYVLAKCGCKGDGATVEYDYPTGDLVVSEDFAASIDYWWRPRIGDLNLDGAVDILDLQALAKVYGTTTAIGGYGDLGNLDHIVNIYDFVVIAKYFGKPYTCPGKEMKYCWKDP
jgi:hypothetical protein